MTSSKSASFGMFARCDGAQEYSTRIGVAQCSIRTGRLCVRVRIGVSSALCFVHQSQKCLSLSIQGMIIDGLLVCCQDFCWVTNACAQRI
jgi:hypothetical protein